MKRAPLAWTVLIALLAAGAPGCEQRSPRPESPPPGAVPGGSRRVESIQFITHGGAPAYSAALHRIAFQRFDPAIIGAPNLAGVNDRTGTFELWTANPDGSEAVCLTGRDIPGGPRLNQHKGAATWHPSGRWLVVAVEMPARAAPHAKAHAGTGAYVDLWAVSPDGAAWRQLTRYANAATASRFPDQPVGALIPRFSRRGDRLAWAEMIGYDAAHPFGIWRLVLADFLEDGDGPRLANLVRSEPGGPRTTFYEPWSFSPDDSLLAIASDHGAIHPGYMDVQLWNPAAGTLVNLTRTDREYEEQAIFSPDGEWLAYMSTAGQSPRYNPSRDFRGTFRTDIWLMKADGTGAERLTWFNDPAHAEYLPDGVNRAIPVSWSPDGRALSINVDRNRGERELHESKRIYRINLNLRAATPTE